jgi:hypothetical protein
MIPGPTLLEILGFEFRRHGQTLEDIDGDVWGELDYPSSLVERVHSYRTIRIGDMQVEHIRLLLGQGVGVEVLMPLALQIVDIAAVVSGDLYPGDLAAVMGLEKHDTYWKSHPDEKKRYLAALNANISAENTSSIRDDFIEIRNRMTHA